jgi:dTDP-L-rhamnose 4-epimerase
VNKHILVTGGAGFIGSKLCQRLDAENFRVTVLDSLAAQVHGDAPSTSSSSFGTLPNRVEFLQVDIRNIHEYQNLLNKVDVIVHLAAETGTGQSMYSLSRYVDINVSGTAVLLEAISNRNRPLNRFLLTSSRAVYGEGCYFCSKHGYCYPNKRDNALLAEGMFDPICQICSQTLNPTVTDEDSPLNPLSTYAITKVAQEQLVNLSASNMNFEPVVLRLQNVYGAGQSLVNPYTGILSIFSTRILNGGNIDIFEDGQESRDFIHVDDVVNAIFLSIESKKAIGGCYNVGTGVLTTVNSVVKMLMRELGSEVDCKITGHFREGDIRHNFSDSTLLEKTLGFKPKIGVDAGLSEYACWVKSQSRISDLYEHSLKELYQNNLLK